MANKPRPQIVQNPDREIPVQILAEHIEKLAAIGKQLDESRLTKRVIVLLLHDMTVDIPMGKIGQILDALPLLAETYLKKKKTQHVV